MIPRDRIEQGIYLIRGQKVMLDFDLAGMYGVETKRLVEAVKRNITRFPEDFMFQLSIEEDRCLKNIGDRRSARRQAQQDQTVKNLRSQSATSSSQLPEMFSYCDTAKYGGRRSLPYCFTEQGVAMLSAVLKSQRAIAVSIEIVRTFVKLREMLSSNVELARRLTAIEEKYDEQFKVIFDAIRELTIPPNPSKGRIGF